MNNVGSLIFKPQMNHPQHSNHFMLSDMEINFRKAYSKEAHCTICLRLWVCKALGCCTSVFEQCRILKIPFSFSDYTFTLDTQKLQRRYVQLQRSLHPDNFSQKSAVRRGLNNPFIDADESDKFSGKSVSKSPLNRRKLGCSLYPVMLPKFHQH